MTLCVACANELTFPVEVAEEHNMRGTSSAEYINYVDDDVHLTCGCHFHWCVSPSKLYHTLTVLPC